MTAQRTSDLILRTLRDFALTHPGAHEKSPWPGHRDVAVKNKTFAYLSIEGEPLQLSCKLPRSQEVALLLPGTSPTAYGLGKSGWVTAALVDGQAPPIDIWKDWIRESYCAQAPKRLQATLAQDATSTIKATGPRKQAATKPAKQAATKPAKKAAKKAAKIPANKAKKKPARRAAVRP